MIYGYMIYGYMDIWIWIYGYMDIWVYEYTDILIYGYMDIFIILYYLESPVWGLTLGSDRRTDRQTD